MPSGNIAPEDLNDPDCVMARRQSPDAHTNWLDAIIRHGEARGWCIKTSCTTCGSNEFRRAVLVESARLVGVTLPSDLVAPWRVAVELPLEARMALYQVQSSAYEELGGQSMHSPAMSLIRWDISRLKLQYGEWIPQALRGHPLVEQWVQEAVERERSLALERKRWCELQEEARRQKEEAKRKVLELRQQRHRARCDARREFSMARLALIERLKQMSMVARLEWLASDNTWTIDALPAELFLPTAEIVYLVDVAVRRRVMARIDRRRGNWGQVLRQLQVSS